MYLMADWPLIPNFFEVNLTLNYDYEKLNSNLISLLISEDFFYHTE